MFVVQPACQLKCGCNLECKQMKNPKHRLCLNKHGLFNVIIHMHSLGQRKDNNSCDAEHLHIGTDGLMFFIIAILGHTAAAYLSQ